MKYWIVSTRSTLNQALLGADYRFETNLDALMNSLVGGEYIYEIQITAVTHAEVIREVKLNPM